MTKKKKVTILTLLVATGLLLVLGSTYALWQLTKTQSDTNEITATCLDITYADESSGISLSSAWPVTDSEGKEEEGYSFTITNNCDEDIDYNVELQELNGNNLPSKYIRFELDYTKDSDTLKDRTDTVYYMDDGVNGKVLDVYTVEANDTNTHTLKLWIDENTPVGYQSKTYNSKISVTAGQGIKAPQIIASETVGTTDCINYTWYDNGDLFIDLLNEDVYSEQLNINSYLTNYYIQNNSDGLFTTEEKEYVQAYVNSHETVPNELYLSLVDKSDIAFMKARFFNPYQEVIGNPRNNSFKEDIYNAIENTTLKSVYQKISDNMPRFNRIYANVAQATPNGFIMDIDANRISLNFADTEDDWSMLTISSLPNSSFNSIDIRAYDYLGVETSALYSVYAPNATLTLPNVYWDYAGGEAAKMLYFDTIEIQNVESGKGGLGASSSLWMLDEVYHVNTIILPGNIDTLSMNRVLMNNFEFHSLLPKSEFSDINIKIRGPQKSITGFTPGNFKSVTWNYYE